MVQQPFVSLPVLFSANLIFFNTGLYGFDTRGPNAFPSMRMHYWSNVLRTLRGVVGAEVIVTSVPGFVAFTCSVQFLELKRDPEPVP
jgi:triacylglycerol lipase